MKHERWLPLALAMVACGITSPVDADATKQPLSTLAAETAEPEAIEKHATQVRPAPAGTLEGLVSNVSLAPSNGTLVLTLADGKEQSLSIESGVTTLFKDGEAISIKQLSIGQRVRATVVATATGKLASAIEVLAPAPGAEPAVSHLATPSPTALAPPPKNKTN